MKIKNLIIWTVYIPLTRPYTIAYKTIGHVENVFVKIEASDGLFGVGCASPSENVTGESFEDCKSALNQHAEEILIGQNPMELTMLSRKIFDKLPHTPAARTALETALFDLFAKKIELPLCNYLGRVHKELPTSITIGIKPVQETLEEAKEYFDRGFRILKLKTGKNLEEDIEKFVKIKERFSNQFKIRVDANQGYDLQALLKFTEKTKNLGLEFIEQPFKAKQIQEMLDVPEEIRKFIAADETLLTEKEAFRLIQKPLPFGIFNIKMMKCGGIASALKMADMAHLAGIDLMWGCNDESIVSISAALHTALACPATKYLDLDGSFDLEKDVAAGGFILEDGLMRIDDNKVGLGVELL